MISYRQDFLSVKMAYYKIKYRSCSPYLSKGHNLSHLSYCNYLLALSSSLLVRGVGMGKWLGTALPCSLPSVWGLGARDSPLMELFLVILSLLPLPNHSQGGDGEFSRSGPPMS